MATERARKEAVVQCERNGAIFAEREAINNGGLLGHVIVAGECLKPGEPGYEEALKQSGATE